MNFPKTIFLKYVWAVPVTLVLLIIFRQRFSQIATIEENSRDLKVKYLNGDNESLFFNLKYNNESGNDFKIMVLGETGEVLFQNNYSVKKLRKVVRLPRLTDTDKVTFLLKPIKSNVQLICKVQVSNKVEEAMVEEDN
ncbi:MAG: hypothetical protein WDN26_22380 [Chitinophagaceae bacterium]